MKRKSTAFGVLVVSILLDSHVSSGECPDRYENGPSEGLLVDREGGKYQITFEPREEVFTVGDEVSVKVCAYHEEGIAELWILEYDPHDFSVLGTFPYKISKKDCQSAQSCDFSVQLSREGEGGAG